MTRTAELRWLAAITAAAALARLPGLAVAPPGLLLDEGRMGLLAQAVLRGEDPRPWLHSVEILAWIPTVALFSFLPDSTAVLRLVPALWGTLTIPALWWAVRPVGGPAIALGAAAALALMRWHVALTRIAVSGYLMPLVAIVAAGCLARAWAHPGSRWWLLSGLATGVGMHTYPGSRVLPLVVGAGIAGWWRSEAGALVGEPSRAASIRRWVAGFGAGFLVAGWYLPWNPERFLLRVGEVAAEVPDTGAALIGFVRGLGALNVGGSDLTHTWPAPGGSALLGPLANLLWLPGIALAVARSGGPVRWLLVAWLVAGFAGGFAGPHGMRQFLLAPVAALGVAAACVALLRRVPAGGRAATIVLLLGAHAGGELWRYALGRHGGIAPGTVEWVYRGHEVALAGRLRAEAAAGATLNWSPAARDPQGTPVEWYGAPTLFLTGGAVGRDPAPAAGLVVFPVTSVLHRDVLTELYPRGTLWEGRLPDGRRAVALAVPVAETGRASIPLGATAELFRGMWAAELGLERGDPAGAAAAAHDLAGRYPAVAGIRTLHAGALYTAGDHRGAEVAAREAVHLGAPPGSPHLYLGAALLSRRAFAEAAAALEVATRHLPDNEQAWLGRVAALANAGQRERARSVMADALRRFPDSAAARHLAAQLNR